MAKIQEYGLACEECVQAIANDDFTGLDYYLSAADAAKREKEIRAGINSAGGFLIVGEELGFTCDGCDICGSSSAGDKHTVHIDSWEKADHTSCKYLGNDAWDCGHLDNLEIDDCDCHVCN